MARTPVDVHTMVWTRGHRDLFARGLVRGRDIVEFGVGTGVLTQLMLDGGARSILGYEILPDVCSIKDPRLTLRIEDFTTATIPWREGLCIVSNPPYSTLPFLVEHALPRVQDVLLMVPPRALTLFAGDYVEEFRLPGEAFDPPSRGEHVVLRKGFGS